MQWEKDFRMNKYSNNVAYSIDHLHKVQLT